MRARIIGRATVWVWVAAVALLVPAIVRADLTVKEATTMSGMMGMLSAKGNETTYIKGDKMRSEGKTEIGGMFQGAAGEMPDMVTITRLDKGVLWFLNAEDSTYAEMAIEGLKADSSAEGSIKVKDVSVNKTGQTKTIISYKCEGTEVDITFEMTVGEGEEREVQTHHVKALFWMRPEVKGLEELRRFWDQMVDVARASQQGSPMTEAMGPVFAKVKDIQGVPLGLEMTMANPMGAGEMDEAERAEMKAAMEMMKEMMKGSGQSAAGDGSGDASEDGGADIKVTRYVTSVTRGNLSDSLFELPKGYTRTENLEGMLPPDPGAVPGD